jgi:hypothetical protein
MRRDLITARLHECSEFRFQLSGALNGYLAFRLARGPPTLPARKIASMQPSRPAGRAENRTDGLGKLGSGKCVGGLIIPAGPLFAGHR